MHLKTAVEIIITRDAEKLILEILGRSKKGMTTEQIDTECRLVDAVLMQAVDDLGIGQEHD